MAASYPGDWNDMKNLKINLFYIFLLKRTNFNRKKMTSKALRIENPVKRPIVPPISPNWASKVT